MKYNKQKLETAKKFIAKDKEKTSQLLTSTVLDINADKISVLSSGLNKTEKAELVADIDKAIKLLTEIIRNYSFTPLFSKTIPKTGVDANVQVKIHENEIDGVIKLMSELAPQINKILN